MATSATSEKVANLYQNFVPISLLMLAGPLIWLAVTAKFVSESNSEKIEMIRQNKFESDTRLIETLDKFDSKLDRHAVLLERNSAMLEALEIRMAEIKNPIIER